MGVGWRVRRSSGWSSGRSAAPRSSTACDRSTCPCSCSAWRSRAVTTVACAWRWHLVARGLGVEIALPAAVAACYRAQFLNTVLPGGVLGDVHRGVVHGRDAGETGRGAARRRLGAGRGAGRPGRRRGARRGAAAVARASRAPWVLAGVVVVAAVAGWWSGRRGATAGAAGWPARPATTYASGCSCAGRGPGSSLASLVALAGYVATYVVAARAVGVHGPRLDAAPAGARGARRRRAARSTSPAGVRARAWRRGRSRPPGSAPRRAWRPRWRTARWCSSRTCPARRGAGVARRRRRLPRREEGPCLSARTRSSAAASRSTATSTAPTPERLVLSNDADLGRVDEVRPECDAILVGAGTVRDDNPRLLVRDPVLRERRRARGMAESPTKVTHDPARPARRRQQLLRDRRQREARLLRQPVGPRGPRAGWARWRRSSTAGADVEVRAAQRGPPRPRRATADGRGRGTGAHPVPHRRRSPTSCTSSSRRSSSATRRRGGSSATAPSPGTRATARGSPRPSRSATWCCCATPSRRASRRPHERRPRARRAARRVRTPLGGPAAAAWPTGPRARPADHLRRAGRRSGARGRRAGEPCVGDPRPVGVPARCGCTASASPATCSAAQRCDCGPQLEEAIARVSRRRRLPALPAPGGTRHRALQQDRRLRPAGPRARHLRGQRALGFADDARDYTVAVQMLEALGVDRLDLLSQQPRQGGPARGGRHPGRAPGAHRPAPEPGQPRLPRHQGRRWPRAAAAGALTVTRRERRIGM